MLYPIETWKWFGDVAHFICGQWCRFHMTTQVGPWLVSTLGRYVHPRHSQGHERPEIEWLDKNPNGEEVGCGRFYETMVFMAGSPCSAEGCNCGLPLPHSCDNVDFQGYLTPADANAGHMQMCMKWAELSERPHDD